MHVPRPFAEDDPTILDALIDAHPFGLLTSVGADGPLATHVPFLRVPRGNGAVLQGHVARANPHWRALAEDARVRVVFSGPHGYVSPTWYGPSDLVPTWNYVAVHVTGTARLISDADALRQLVDDLSTQFEADLPSPWSVDQMSAKALNGMLRAIVGIEVSVDQTVGVRKLSQNRTQSHRQGVIRALMASPRPDDRGVAEAMMALEPSPAVSEGSPG